MSLNDDVSIEKSELKEEIQESEAKIDNKTLLPDSDEQEDELNKIESLTIDQIRSYLNKDPICLVPSSNNIVNNHQDNDNQILKRPKTRKRRFKFTYVKANKYKLKFKKLNQEQTSKIKQQEDEEEEEPCTESNEVSFEDIDEDQGGEEQNENDNNFKAIETEINKNLTEYLVQGKLVPMAKSDYERYVKNGKWRSAEFFRFKPAAESKCEFCSFKCKSTTEGHYICSHCRFFAQKSLVKHHMFVCKDKYRSQNEHCPFKRQSDGVMHSDTIYCRYCHFNLIVNKIPSLNRLQKHLVQFINNRVIYVNSVSKKTMLWRSRLMVNNDQKPKTDKPAKPKQEPTVVHEASKSSSNKSKPVTKSSPIISTRSSNSLHNQTKNEIKSNVSNLNLSNLDLKQSLIETNTTNTTSQLPTPTNEKENDFINQLELLNESVNERKGPRVKHVSRAQPVYLNQVDNLLSSTSSITRSKSKFYNELKNINDDKQPVFINWQSFTSDLKTEFTLSALPEKFKSHLVKTYDPYQFQDNNNNNNNNKKSSFLNNFQSNSNNTNSNNKSLSDDLMSNELGNKNDIIDNQTTDDSSNLSSSNGSTSKPIHYSSLVSRSKANSLRKLIAAPRESNMQETSNSTVKPFDWDDYFEKNHRISSNQNFRLSSLNQVKEISIPKNMSCMSKASSLLSNSSSETSQFDLLQNIQDQQFLNNGNKNSQLTSSKRFTCKLNSYKDRFQPYNIDCINDKLKDSTKLVASQMSDVNDKNNNSLNSNKNFYINTSDLTNSSSSNAVNSLTNLVKYPFVIPDYLVWDNNIVNKISEIPKVGFSIISYYPYCIKSACFLCGSGSETENQLFYCSVCCESYHFNCLKEHEKPKKNSLLLNWVCPSCKYCEICNHQNELQHCYTCGDSFHSDCLKKSNYPRKPSKKSKTWICFKCFECKICESKTMYYEKKTFNKMLNFDFSTCFKCHEKYNFEKPFKCCNVTFNDLITINSAKIKIDKLLYECNKCNQYFHFDCLNLPKEEIDLLKQSPFKFECKFCDNGSANLIQLLNELKLKIFQDIFNRIDKPGIDDFDTKLVDYLKSYFAVENQQVELSRMINEFYLVLTNENNEPDNNLKIRFNLVEILKKKYSILLDKLSEYETLIKKEDLEVKSDLVEENKTKQTEQTDKENLLTQKRKNFFFNDLVKCPYEDHTYAISSNSLALALESSNLFNQGNTESFNLFLDQIKEVQMNPTLQKIFNNKLLLTQQEQTMEKTANLNDLDNLKNFSNIKKDSIDYRECIACGLIGDSDICGRLFPFDGYWIHMNCLLWSDDVYIEGHMINQILSVFQKTKTICCHCKRDGATISCYNKTCNQTYHFNCAFESKCFISDDLSNVLVEKLDKKQKTNGYFLYCPEHSSNFKVDPESIKNMIKNIKIKKSLIIDLKDESYRRKYSFPKFSLKPPKSNPYILIGSLQIENLGDLETISDYKDFLCPINFTCTRLYWSTNEIGKKVLYKCRILHIDEYKREQEKLAKEKEREQTESEEKNKIDSNLIDSNDLKFYLENYCDKEESLANLSNDLPDSRLDSICQVDGLNDNLFNQQQTSQSQNKNILKFPNLNSLSVVQKFTQMNSNQLNIVNRPLITNNLNTHKIYPPIPPVQNPNINPNDKPKVLKLESSLKCFSNIKTSFVRIDRPTPAQSTIENSNSSNSSNESNKQQLNLDLKPNINFTNSEFFLNKNFLLNSRQNENTISPRSDRSDSSLNLNHSSNILNPMPSSFEDLISQNTSQQYMIPQQLMELSQNTSTQQNQTPKVTPKIEKKMKEKTPKEKKKPKVEKEKKPKKIKTESVSTKCTVAALLNAFNKDKPEPAQPLSPEKPKPIINPTTPVSSSTDLATPQVAEQVPPIDQLINLPTASAIPPIIMPPPLPPKKKTVSQKVKNKLRDYFKDELNKQTNLATSPSKIDFSTNLTISIPNSKFEIKTDTINEPKIEANSLIKTLEAKILERKNKKKDGSLKTKTKFSSGIEKKKAKLNKEINLSSSPQLLTKQSKLSSQSIVNNQYNDLDLGNPNSLCYRGQLVFEITCEDGLRVVSYDINKAWKVIFEKIKKLRQDYKLKCLSYKNTNGVKMLGLNTRAVAYMIEQLESIQFCPLYKTRFIHSQNSNDKWIINLNNCARTAKQFDGNKKCLDPFYWLSSEHRSLNTLSLNQRFDQKFFQSAKSLQSLDMGSSMKYRHLKDFSKSALVVKRSPIHGRGLFSLVDLNQSQMIIEYAGEIIRNELCDKREKYYESKGIGCYMFRIDEFEVIDATTKGNQARFINHSCDPNCISKVLVIQGHKHIVIFAQRFIARGEELTYDYKFPKEDVKIKCLCKSSKCRKYLN